MSSFLFSTICSLTSRRPAAAAAAPALSPLAAHLRSGPSDFAVGAVVGAILFPRLLLAFQADDRRFDPFVRSDAREPSCIDCLERGDAIRRAAAGAGCWATPLRRCQMSRLPRGLPRSISLSSVSSIINRPDNDEPGIYGN
jgi:hypothetical protein